MDRLTEMLSRNLPAPERQLRAADAEACSSGKRRHPNRLAAESALDTARQQWRNDPSRAAHPPIRIYRCERCGDWHLTSKEVTG